MGYGIRCVCLFKTRLYGGDHESSNGCSDSCDVLVLFVEVASADEISVTTLNIGAAPDGRLPSRAPLRPRHTHPHPVRSRDNRRHSNGHLAPLASGLYVLAAQRGQAMEAFVDSPGALLYLWGPDGGLTGAEQKAAWHVVLPAKGDYFVAVNSTGHATDYKLTVIIDTPNAAGATRIRFAAGGTSACVSGRIAAGAWPATCSRSGRPDDASDPGLTQQ